MRSYPWRMFALLVVLGTASAMLLLPYQLALQPELVARFGAPALVVSSLVNSLVVFAVAVGVGLLAMRATGLDAPLTRAVVEGGSARAALRRLGLPGAVALGAATGVVLVVLDATLFAGTIPASALPAARRPGPLEGLLASFYGGIGEELQLRLCVMSVVLWLAGRVLRAPDGRPSAAAAWVAIGAAALLFGIGHLPATASIVPLTPPVVLRALVLNGIGGLAYGWLYWRRGLEAGMAAHFATDLVLHVIVPALTRG